MRAGRTWNFSGRRTGSWDLRLEEREAGTLPRWRPFASPSARSEGRRAKTRWTVCPREKKNKKTQQTFRGSHSKCPHTRDHQGSTDYKYMEDHIQGQFDQNRNSDLQVTSLWIKSQTSNSIWNSDLTVDISDIVARTWKFRLVKVMNAPFQLNTRAICSSDSTVTTPLRWDLTDIYMIKWDFSRTNIKDIQWSQLVYDVSCPRKQKNE